MSGYRDKPESDPGETELVTVATFLDVVEAEMARADLDAIGVEAFVFEPTGFNPLLSQAAGGIRLAVRAADAGNATVHLAEGRRAAPRALAENDGSGGDPEAVRCPRCELAFCYFGRARLTSGGSVSPLMLVFFPLVALFGPKRHRCLKCHHVWDDAAEGPRRLTAVPSHLRPVFRLRRGSPGLGALLGSVGGVAVAAAGVDAPIFLVIGLGAAGSVVGSAFRSDVCSEPGCRAPLPPDAPECPSCHGVVAGVITRAHAHYAESAVVRRELAATRRRKKKRAARG